MADIHFVNQKEAFNIPNSATVKVKQMNHIIEVVHVAREPHILEEYKKLNKDKYAVIDPQTGEVIDIKEYKLNENRAQNIAGVKRTMKKIRNLINNNFTGAPNELFITLTYALIDGKPMSDVAKASKDFDIFIKRFRRKFSDLQYFAVLEPQGSSAWHWHLLVKFTKWSKCSHIHLDNNSVVQPIWGHGWTKTKAINTVDNLGSYLSAYLGDIEITDENKENLLDNVLKDSQNFDIIEKDVTDDNGKRSTKKFIKGGRLHLYPSGTNIYRCSRGINKPIRQIMTYSEAKRIIGSKKPDFSRSISIVDNKNSDKTLNTITYEHYNLKRKTRPQTISSQPTS